MTGAYANQQIWVQVGGGTTLATLNELWEAYLSGAIGSYRAWCFDPIEFRKPEEERGPLVYTMPIPYVQNFHERQICTVITEDELDVKVSAAGALMDIVEWSNVKRVHLGVNYPTNTKYMVTGLTDIGGQPGNNQIVRRVIEYQLGKGAVMTIPTPNMIAKSGFVIIS